MSVTAVVAPSRPTPAPQPARAPWAAQVALAVSRYRTTGIVAAVAANGFTVYPYGHGAATLTCLPLRACLVVLATGETLTAPPIAGDTVRWSLRVVRAGDGVAAPLVVVQARDCDLSTNLVLATETRMYQVQLEAPECNAKAVNYNPRGSVTHLAFYDPDSGGALLHTVPVRPAVAVNRAYVVRADKAIAWRPLLVYDDGSRTVIELPAAARREALPVLYALAEDGSREVVNYTVTGSTYTADRVFRAAALVVRSGKAERVVRIENRGPSRPGGTS